MINSILPDIRQQEHKTGSDESQGRSDVKRVSARSDFVVAGSRLQGVESVGASKGADFADGSGDAVVLAT